MNNRVKSGRWSGGFYGQGVDVGLQQVADGGIDQPMPRHRSQVAEGFGHDGDAEMAVAARRSRMAGVQVTLVLDEQQGGRKTNLQAPAQALFTGGRLVHGQAWPWPWPWPGPGSGSDCAALVLVLSQKTWGSMNTSMAAVMPNTLKFTQILSSKFRAT